MTRHQHARFLALVLGASAVVAACGSGHAAESGTVRDEPASVAVVGRSALHRITLTPDAARRIGLATTTIDALPAGHGSRTSVATAAVFYDQDGRTWVYQRVAALTFLRARVVVTRTDGAVTVLRSGPPAGSVVATVGVAELRGAEDGVPGEQ